MGRDLTIREVTIHQYFGPERRDPASRNRRAMLEKVWAIWITGVLQPSLPQDILLDLGLAEHPAMVTRTLDLYVQRPNLTDQVQAPDTRLIDVFDRLDRALLILGAPGSGKTTLLLTLARDLLIRAAQDAEHPIPVVFPLSSWAKQRRTLAAWLVDALSEQYDVPRKLGQTWVEADQILPLLDGLDEVAPEHRAACAEAINTFRQEHGLLSLVVCSRVADYEALGARLRLQGAVVALPLTSQQVEHYLTQVGQPVAAVRQALQEDPTLWEFLDTPLMLTVVSLVYGGKPTEALCMAETLEVKRQHLFATYVDQMFQRRGILTRYTSQQTIQWLAWLARQMTQHSQTTFYLERMQPDWLPHSQRWMPTIGVGLGVGLIMALHSINLFELGTLITTGQLLTGHDWTWISAEFEKMGLSLFWGLILIFGSGPVFNGLISGLFAYSKSITSVEVLHWSWSATKSGLLSTLKFGLYGVLVLVVVGLLGGLILGLWQEKLIINGLLGGAAMGAIFGLLLLILVIPTVGVVRGIVKGLSRSELGTKTIPNQGIHRSARTALISGLVGGPLVDWVLSLSDLPSNLVSLMSRMARASDEMSLWHEILVMVLPSWAIHGSLVELYSSWEDYGTLVALYAGGRACLQHLVLRYLLLHNGAAPWRYVAFLDYAAERLFLRKVGGGYMFVHRLLQEYFAARHTEPWTDVPQKSAERRPSVVS